MSPFDSRPFPLAQRPSALDPWPLHPSFSYRGVHDCRPRNGESSHPQVRPTVPPLLSDHFQDVEETSSGSGLRWTVLFED